MTAHTEPPATRDPGSYRDPYGFVFTSGGVVYRQVNQAARRDWEALTSSGLLAQLRDNGWLIAHEAAPASLAQTAEALAVIRPEQVPFVTYPYEWTFSQLQDAATLTLDVQAAALDRGMSLRDASAFNVQFMRGRPVLIDTLSFEVADLDAPWVAYRQFCEHFLAPLAVMAYDDPSLSLLLRPQLEGIPLPLASTLLPRRTWLRPGIAAHVHLHARAMRTEPRSAAGRMPRAAGRMGIDRHLGLVQHLRSTVTGLHVDPAGTTWAGYGDAPGSYSSQGLEAKQQIVRDMLSAAAPGQTWDIGANTGAFSRLAADSGRDVIAVDADWAAAERHYRAVRERGEERILPLIADVAAPTPSLGWALEERRSLLERGDAQLLLALALIHHLAIGRNVPLASIARLFAALAPEAIVEFVPKGDPMVQEMLAARRDVFPDYSLDGFRNALAGTHAIVREAAIPGSDRTLLHLRRHA